MVDKGGHFIGPQELDPGEAALIDARMYEDVTRVVDLSGDLKRLKPVEVIVDPESQTPDDLAKALEEAKPPTTPWSSGPQ